MAPPPAFRDDTGDSVGSYGACGTGFERVFATVGCVTTEVLTPAVVAWLMVPDPRGTELPDIQCVRPSWQARAACRGMGTNGFIASRGDNARATAAAKGVCHTCGVVAECLAYALEDDELVGIWGGTSEKERARMRAGGGVVAGVWSRETRRSRGRRLAGANTVTS
jgi:WhiB family redox-sensing transcriptional regulator